VIVLDDVFQHRSIDPDLNILLNDYNRPFYKDRVIPAGLLRESRKHAARADAVVVSKCPVDLPESEMIDIKKQIQKYSVTNVPIFFSSLKYLKPVSVFGNGIFSKNVMLFSGIANADPLEKYVKEQFNLLSHKRFPDHYAFTGKDLKELAEAFDLKDSEEKCLLTTEKDMMRLISMKEESKFLAKYPVFYLPIELYFLESGDLFAEYLNRKVAEGLIAVGHQ